MKLYENCSHYISHRDFEHIERLVKRLATFSDIYIHIDSLVDQSDLVEALKDIKNCFFLQNRIHCGWGCWNGVVATVELLRATLDKYDRISFFARCGLSNQKGYTNSSVL